MHKDSTEMVSNIFEYENCKVEVKDKVLNVKCRLRKHSDFWRNVLKARENVCNIIFSGYIVPFTNCLNVNIVKITSLQSHTQIL